MKKMNRPDPNKVFPNPNLPRLCFIKVVPPSFVYRSEGVALAFGRRSIDVAQAEGWPIQFIVHIFS